MADKPKKSKKPKTPQNSTTPLKGKVIWLSPQGPVEIDMTPGVPLPKEFARFVGNALGSVFGPELGEHEQADMDAVAREESVASNDTDDPT